MQEGSVWGKGRGGGWDGGGLERLENDRWRLCVSVCGQVNAQCCSGLFFALKKNAVTNIDLKTTRGPFFPPLPSWHCRFLCCVFLKI